MKRSGVKTPIKATKQTKSIRKVVPPKDVSETEESVDEEEEVVEKKVVKKQGLKKGVKVVPPKNVAESEESIDEEEEVVEKKVAKKQGLKKGAKVVPPKNVAESEESIEEEEVVLKKKVAKKQGLKKGAKTKTRVESKVVEEDDDDEGDNQEEDDEEEEVLEEKVVKKHGLKKGTKAKTRVESKVVEEDDGEEDDDDEGDNQEDDDEEEDNQEDDEDDVESDEEEQVDEGDEAEEDKELATDDKNDEDEDFDMKAYLEECKDERSSPSEILSGPLRFDYHPQQCVHVTNLPKNASKIDIIKAFEIFGYISQIHIVRSHKGIAFVNIAFETIDSALAAAKYKNLKVLDKIVTVGRKPKFYVDKKMIEQRTVHVANITEDTTKDDLKTHFESFGKIVERVKLLQPKTKPPFAFVILKKKDDVRDLSAVHNSFLNGTNIRVSYNHKKILIRECYENRSVVLKNKQNLRGIELSKLEAIFSKCGKIQYIDILCRPRLLAYITFTTEEAAIKAVEMDGQTQQGLELEIQHYSLIKNFTTIHIFNLDPACTTEDIQNHFAKAGPIANIVLKRQNAIVRFKDTESFCKSFLLNETYIKNRSIFVEPLCKKKSKIYESANKRARRKSRLPHF